MMREHRFAAGAALAAVALGVVALVIGPGDLGPAEVGEVIRARVTGGEPALPDASAARSRAAQVVILDLRLARTIVVALVGGALACSGAVAQGLFRNALAEPGVLGVSSGAAAAAVIAFALDLDRLGAWVAPAAAAVGAIATLAVLFALVGARSATATLLLSGIAIGALGSAIVTLVLSLQAHRWDLGVKVVHWLMGSFESRSWPHVAGALPPVAAGLAVALWLRRDLDVLHLGDETAASLGVDLPRTRAWAIVAVALLVGAATAVAGVIGFVGLIVPHMCRAFVGPMFRRLLPAAFALGAAILVLVDVVVRGGSSIDLPPGVVTSFVGAPFFLWLVRRPREDRAP
jgi:iron complex transport system permease protein